MRKQTKKWKTKDGSKIRICDMTDAHLLNALKCVKRKAEQIRSEVENVLWSLPEPRGEMAALDIETARTKCLDATWEDVIEEMPSLFDNLAAEAARRKIDIKFLWEEAKPKKDRYKRARSKCSK